MIQGIVVEMKEPDPHATQSKGNIVLRNAGRWCVVGKDDILGPYNTHALATKMLRDLKPAKPTHPDAPDEPDTPRKPDKSEVSK